jgi:glycosyltransferase domain-containing protein
MISKPGDCTILVLSRNRDTFLERFNKFVGYQNFFPVIVMDGSDFKSVLSLNSQKCNFEYFYTGRDESIPHFIRKSIVGLNLVKTKYVMLASDDDFYSESAIKTAIEFLNTNTGFVAHSNRAIDFSILSNVESEVYGEIANLRVWNLSKNNEFEDPAMRIYSYLQSKGSLWHAVVRTDAMKETWNMIQESNPTRFETVEILLNIGLALFGRARADQSDIILFHQVHRNMIAKSIMSDKHLAKDSSWKNEYLQCVKQMLVRDSSVIEVIGSDLGLTLFLRDSTPALRETTPALDFSLKIGKTFWYFFIYNFAPSELKNALRIRAIRKKEAQIPESELELWNKIKNLLLKETFSEC